MPAHLLDTRGDSWSSSGSRLLPAEADARSSAHEAYTMAQEEVEWLKEQLQGVELEIKEQLARIEAAMKAKESPELISLIREERDRLVDKEKDLRHQLSALQAQLATPAGGPVENIGALIGGVMHQVKTTFEEMLDSLARRMARHHGVILEVSASNASAYKVLELLRRVYLDHSQDQVIPCCTKEADLPALPVELEEYTWEGSEASAAEVEKGRRWLTKHICPPGTVVIAVQDQAWLYADFQEEDATITASKTDYLIALDTPEVKALENVKPKPEQLTGILRWIIGAYEVKTSTFVRNRGILGVWAQAVLEALALNYMAHRGNGAYFIPVFGGDLHQHLVVHAAPKKGDFMLHAAKQADPDSPGLAVRYMRYLLQKTKDAVDATLQGGAGPSENAAQVSAPVYRLRGRGAKRKREPEEAADESDDEQGDDGPDADAAMQAAENAYHLDLVNMLRQPRMYRALGLSGPPHRIRHASLEERMTTMQVVQ
ncbi:g4336 [Coccomyxa elongata]